MEPDHCICKHSDVAQLKPPISRIIPCMILAPSLAADYLLVNLRGYSVPLM